MKKLTLFMTAVIFGSVAIPVIAHEFWMQPKSFSPKAGTTENLRLYVGEYYTGQVTGIARSSASALSLYSSTGKKDLFPELPQREVWGEFPIQFGHAGTYIVAFDSTPSLITMPAEKFHAYLHDEGLDFIVKQREASGTTTQPGREHFRRNVKTLLTVDGKSDSNFAAVTGQRLEIVPVTDPATCRKNQTLKFKLMFDSRALENGLVKAWQKQGLQLTMIRVRSDNQGRFSLTLPYSGAWMLSVVHMIPAEDNNEADWDSYWGNITFSISSH